MPQNIYFIRQEDGSMELSFNGGYISIERLEKAKESLDLFLETVTAKEVELHNNEVDKHLLMPTHTRAEIKKKQSGYIYFVKSLDLYKIGRSKNLKNRFQNYTTENPHGAELLASKLVEDYISFETDLLHKYKQFVHRGEWFSLPKEKIQEITSLLS